MISRKVLGMTGTGQFHGQVPDPGHPIMEGISSVCDYYRLANSIPDTLGSSTIAQWSDGSICVAQPKMTRP